MIAVRVSAWSFLSLVLAGCSGRSCSSPSKEVARDAPALVVHRAHAPPKLDGELEETDWQTASRTGAFRDNEDASARPFSEARLLWDEQNLYLGLYAADENIQTSVTEHDAPVWIDDAFSVIVKQDATESLLIDISATGVITDVRAGEAGLDRSWESGTRVGVDRDGSLNDAGDQDEEWVVEAAIPLVKLGIAPQAGARFSLAVSRCDTPRGGRRACAAWGEGQNKSARGVVELEP